MDLDELTPEELELLGQIKDRKRVLVAAHRRRKSAANNNPVMPRGRDTERSISTGEMKVGPFCLSGRLERAAVLKINCFDSNGCCDKHA